MGRWAQKRDYWENELANHLLAQISSPGQACPGHLIPDALSCSPAWGILSCSSRLFLSSCIIVMPGCVSVFPARPRDPWGSGLSPELCILHSGNGRLLASWALNRCLLTKSVRQMPLTSEGRIKGSWAEGIGDHQNHYFVLWGVKASPTLHCSHLGKHYAPGTWLITLFISALLGCSERGPAVHSHSWIRKLRYPEVNLSKVTTDGGRICTQPWLLPLFVTSLPVSRLMPTHNGTSSKQVGRLFLNSELIKLSIGIQQEKKLDFYLRAKLN